MHARVPVALEVAHVAVVRLVLAREAGSRSVPSGGGSEPSTLSYSCGGLGACSPLATRATSLPCVLSCGCGFTAVSFLFYLALFRDVIS